MPEYLSPGVFVEEVSSGLKPLEGVGTSTGAFIGIAERGPIGEPKLITNWTQFKEVFGDFINNGFLAYSVYQFFNEGGSKCYVIRAAKDIAAAPPVAAQPLAKATVNVGDLTVTAKSEGTWANSSSADTGLVIVITAETESPTGTPRADYFKLVVRYKGDVVETFNNINLDENTPDHFAIQVDSDWIDLVEAGVVNTKPADNSYALSGGEDGGMLVSDWAGANGFIHAFDSVDAINIVAIPDAVGDAVVTKDAFTYCENRKDCFFVADMPQGTDGVPAVVAHVQFQSSFAAIYYPWIWVTDPLTGNPKMTPPSGAIVGTYSHTDIARGVHKAPAGIDVGYLNSANGVEFDISKGQHDELNPIGVNVIRSFPGTGSVVWGARTLATKSDPEWKYINVRRLFLFLEETIDEGTQWVVFEPNTPRLWGSVNRNITAFLTGVWRDGALAGSSAAEAFFVKVDAENNPPDVINAGKLIIEIGVAPVKPAEFVIIRISQKALAPA